MSWIKMTGAENDFLIIDLTRSDSALQLEKDLQGRTRQQLAKDLCHRTLNVGADGCIFLEKSKSSSIKWDFYNADGSSAEMCGNAARCVGLFLYKFVTKERKNSIETIAGEVLAEVLDDSTVSVTMTSVEETAWKQSFEYENQSIQFDYINSGVPHGVIEQTPLQSQNSVLNLASILRQQTQWHPGGMNVSFYEPIKAGFIKGHSFERGVEGFTKACGTGAIAMATSYCQNHNWNKEVQVTVPGGDLIVRLDGERPVLIGPAVFIAELKLL